MITTWRVGILIDESKILLFLFVKRSNIVRVVYFVKNVPKIYHYRV